jgi:predicted AAA+ superfamily ATPase
VERDVRQLLQIGDWDRFVTFIKLCAGRIGQLLNASARGGEVGVSHNTIREWLSVLEASYLIKRLRPYHANLGKRLVKTAKLYFVDVGLACHLLGIHRVDHLPSHPQRGALFENLVVIEALKQRLHRGANDNLLFFRDQMGHEVDLLLEDGRNLHAIEIKSAQTVNTEFFKNLNYFSKLTRQVVTSTLVYGGEAERKQSGTIVRPWHRFRIPESV